MRFGTLGGAPLLAVRGTGPSDVWVLHTDGALNHWDGRELATRIEGPPRVQTRSLSVVAPDDVWIATLTGLWRRHGKRWSKVACPARNVSAVLARSSEDVWVADGEGRVYHRDATGSWRSWQVSSNSFGPLLAASEAGVWYANGSAIFRWDGVRWIETQREGESGRIVALDVRASESWAAGDSGTLLRYRDERWSRVVDDAPPDGVAVWGAGDDDVWIAQSHQSLSHWNGKTWTKMVTPDAGTLRDLWGSGPEDVWAVGDVILHWDGRTWSRSPALLWFTLDRVWGSGPDDVWASGRDGVLHWDGCRWGIAQNERDGLFGDGASTNATESFVLRRKPIDRWDGRRWHQEALPDALPPTAIARTTAGEVVAFDRKGTYRREGDRWTQLGPPPPRGSLRLIGLSLDALWTRDEKGTLARWDGRGWTARPQPFPVEGAGLWVSPRGVPWLAGQLGVVSGPAEAIPAVRPALAPAARRACSDAPDEIARALATAKNGFDTNRAQLSPVGAVQAVSDWLSAVAAGDPVGVAERSALPFRVGGLTSDYGPKWRMCGGPPRPGALEGTHAFHDPGMTLEVADEQAFRALLGCLLGDTMLSETIPRGTLGERDPEGRAADVDARPVSRLPARLARFKKELRAAERAHVIVQSESTDNDGITVKAAFVVVGDDATSRVAAVYLDELFEE
jgi:hypothetical protein